MWLSTAAKRLQPHWKSTLLGHPGRRVVVPGAQASARKSSQRRGRSPGMAAALAINTMSDLPTLTTDELESVTPGAGMGWRNWAQAALVSASFAAGSPAGAMYG